MSETRKDRIFSQPAERIKPFEFNEKVAHVFDDMAKRSIPFYREVQGMVTELASAFFKPGTVIYDLGCSTGTTAILLANQLHSLGHSEFEIHGIDSSKPMCEEAVSKINDDDIAKNHVRIHHGNITSWDLANASVVIMNYTLQFIPPLKREELVNRVFSSLIHKGIFLVSEKNLQSSTDISRIFIDRYYDFKRQNGYSELEISRKREALENILIPYSVEEEKKLFRQAGFESVDMFFTWYNFSSFICMK
ncbi:MAG: carboxy-S-adenosyl-L-methionine synthase CmoA [Spirochaetia bacterium]